MNVAASAPAAGNVGASLYQVYLVGGVAKLSAAPFYDSSTASVANSGSSHGQSNNLALTTDRAALEITRPGPPRDLGTPDPDSSTVVPCREPALRR